jgi:REP element-mobilizing transposase RayT
MVWHEGDMPRTARAVVSGCAHHVIQRGNNRQDAFFADADPEAYLGYLHEAAGRFGVRVEGYCPMTNHVHLVVTPLQESSLPAALQRTNQLCAQYINRLHGCSGHFASPRAVAARSAATPSSPSSKLSSPASSGRCLRGARGDRPRHPSHRWEKDCHEPFHDQPPSACLRRHLHADSTMVCP